MSKKEDRYQYQNWFVRRWRDRHLLRVPFEALYLYWYNGPHAGKDEEDYDPLSFSNCWGIACGMADVHREYLYDWDEIKDSFDFSDYPEEEDERTRIE